MLAEIKINLQQQSKTHPSTRMGGQVMTELCDWNTGQEGKRCSVGNPHTVYSVDRLCSSLDLKGLSDPATTCREIPQTPLTVSSSSSESHYSCKKMHLLQDLFLELRMF